MRRRFLRLVGVLVVLAVFGVAVAVGVQQSTRQAAATARPVRAVTSLPTRNIAVFWGDSYVNGAGTVGAFSTFAAVAARNLGYTPVILGHGGTGFLAAESDSPHVPDYIRQYKAHGFNVSEQPSFVVIEGGLLDQSDDPVELKSAVRFMLDAAKAAFPKALVILLGPADIYTPPSAGVAKVNSVMASAAASEHVPFVKISDLEPQSVLLDHISTDGIHPNLKGHELLAVGLERELLRLGVRRR